MITKLREYSAKTKRDGQTDRHMDVAISPVPGPTARREIKNDRGGACFFKQEASRPESSAVAPLSNNTLSMIHSPIKTK